MKRTLVSLLVLLLSTVSTAKTVTVSRTYSPDELKEIFSSEPFLKIMEDLKIKLTAVPEDKKTLVTDTQIAFRWGTDWTKLPEFLESHKMMKPLYAAMNSPKQYLTERFIPQRLKDKKKEVPLEPGWERLPFESVKEEVFKAHGTRLAHLNQQLPGFIVWLFDGLFQLPWVIVDKPFTEEFCKNSHVYKKVSQKIVACQTSEFIKIQRSFYNETTNDLKRRTDIYLHEMIRFRVMLLAQVSRMEQSEQDALTARLTYAMLDSNVSSEAFYQKLLDVQLLPDRTNLDGLRQYEIALTIERKMVLLEGLIAFNSECGTSGYKFDHLFYPLINPVIENITECRRYLNSELDDNLCELNTLAFHILDYKNRCTNPLPQKR